MLTAKDLAQISQLVQSALKENNLTNNRSLRSEMHSDMQAMILPVIKELFTLGQSLDEIKNTLKYVPSTDLFLTHMSQAYGELQSMRDTLDIHSTYGDRLTDHDHRIKQLEAVSLSAAHS